jgi:N-acetyltransferase 10
LSAALAILPGSYRHNWARGESTGPRVTACLDSLTRRCGGGHVEERGRRGTSRGEGTARHKMRKKVDSRIRTLVENGVKLNERTLFVVVGDRAREQVVNLHYMLSKAVVKSRPNVLWCYKKELYLSSHKKKRVKQIKKMVSRGLMDPENEDPFSLFVASTDIKYTYYADTQKILGNTYGMAVLQDFEALTPNLLARTVETVEGGGIIVLLLSNLESLSQLYTLTMDVHARFRTESHQNVTGRFNERFILSLGGCPTCIMMVSISQ